LLGQAKNLNALGVVFLDLRQYEKSINASLNALKVSESIGDRLGQAKGWTNLGKAYSYNMAYDEALHALRQAEKFERSRKNKRWLVVVLYEIANVQRRTHDFKNAIESCNAGLEFDRNNFRLMNLREQILEEEERWDTLVEGCQGVIVRWQRGSDDWSWGFIQTDDAPRDVWFGKNVLNDPEHPIQVGDKVTFDYIIGKKSPRATRVETL
jgi:tetratricopeptide (TPR) repeat protein